MEPKFLSAMDYVVVGASLLSALLVGVWQACKHRGKSQSELLVADGMSVLPVALSLVASYLSGILIVGQPAEVYSYGSGWFVSTIGVCLGIITAVWIFVPFFYPLKLTSVFQYLRLRFKAHRVQRLASVAYVVQQVWYMTVALYAPAVAVSSVSPIPIYASLIGTGGICTLYTVMGGLKAVVWTDAIQVFIMLGGLLLVVIKGSHDVGGLSNVWEIAGQYNRTQIFDFSMDPYERNTFWKLVFYFWFAWCFSHGISQPSVQRYTSLKSLTQARMTVLYNLTGSTILWLLASFCGLVVFANYALCDPLKAGFVKRRDQIMPYYVMDTLHDYPGVPGIFIAALLSGSLSTLSSGLNSLAAVTWEDGVKHTKIGKMVSVQRGEMIIKILGFAFGGISLGLAIMVAGMPDFGVIQLNGVFTGMTQGPLFGLFIAAMYLPFVNDWGGLAGLISGMAFVAWLAIGAWMSKIPPKPSLPTSIANCSAWIPDFTTALPITMMTGPTPAEIFSLNSVHDSSTMSPSMGLGAIIATSMDAANGDARSVYNWSYLMYFPLGMVVTMIVTTIVSLLTGGFPLEELDESLVQEWPLRLWKKFCLVYGSRQGSQRNGGHGVTMKNGHQKPDAPSTTTANHDEEEIGRFGSLKMRFLGDRSLPASDNNNA